MASSRVSAFYLALAFDLALSLVLALLLALVDLVEVSARGSSRLSGLPQACLFAGTPGLM